MWHRFWEKRAWKSLRCIWVQNYSFTQQIFHQMDWFSVQGRNEGLWCLGQETKWHPLIFLFTYFCQKVDPMANQILKQIKLFIWTSFLSIVFMCSLLCVLLHILLCSCAMFDRTAISRWGQNSSLASDIKIKFAQIFSKYIPTQSGKTTYIWLAISIYLQSTFFLNTL